VSRIQGLGTRSIVDLPGRNRNDTLLIARGPKREEQQAPHTSPIFAVPRVTAVELAASEYFVETN
jgi:hypothetical protein